MHAGVCFPSPSFSHPMRDVLMQASLCTFENFPSSILIVSSNLTAAWGVRPHSIYKITKKNDDDCYCACLAFTAAEVTLSLNQRLRQESQGKKQQAKTNEVRMSPMGGLGMAERSLKICKFPASSKFSPSASFQPTQAAFQSRQAALHPSFAAGRQRCAVQALAAAFAPLHCSR